MKQPEPNRPPLLTYVQLAKRLNVSLNTARKLVENGDLPRIIVGVRNVRTTPEAVDAYIERHTT